MVSQGDAFSFSPPQILFLGTAGNNDGFLFPNRRDNWVSPRGSRPSAAAIAHLQDPPFFPFLGHDLEAAGSLFAPNTFRIPWVSES